MASFAFVIGINEYESNTMPTLVSPVDDALRMVGWLLDRGAVEPKNLVLLLTPTPAGPEDDAKLEARVADFVETLGHQPGWLADGLAQIRKYGTLKPALSQNILTALARFPKRTSGGERITFYYAGHGLMSRVGFGNEDALIPADYEPDVLKPISVESIVDFLSPLNFPVQVFIMDCCRNAPIGERVLDVAPPAPPISLGTPAADQFIFNATAPGQKALDGRGLLTDLLLAGLLGQGSAKQWDQDTVQYVVRVSRLFETIREGFVAGASRFTLANVDGQAVIQQPRLGGEHTQDPPLVAYPDDRFPDVNLTLDVHAGAAQVIVMGSGVAPQFISGFPSTPVPLKLRPRSYNLAVIPYAGWTPANAARTVDLFQDETWTVQFTPITTTPTSPLASFEVVAQESDGFGLRDDLIRTPDQPVTDRYRTRLSAMDSAWPGRIAVSVPDSQAQVKLELLSRDPGLSPSVRPNVVRDQLGEVVAEKLSPGFYRASAQLPGRSFVDQTVYLTKGASIKIVLVEVTPTASPVNADDEAWLGFDLNPTRDAPATRPATDLFDTQLGLLLATPLEPGSGFSVIASAERSNSFVLPDQEGRDRLDSEEQVAAFLASLQFRLVPLDNLNAATPPLLVERTEHPQVVRLTQAAPSGIHWLRVEYAPGEPGTRPRIEANFATPVLPDQRTGLLLRQDQTGRLTLTLVLLGKDLEDSQRSSLARSIDLAQRYWYAGKLNEAREQLEAEARGDRLDPIAACLVGSMMLRARQLDDLDRLSSRMLEMYPDLPDSHAFRSLHRLATGDPGEATRALREALDLGLPISSTLVKVLSGIADTFDLDHPRRPLLDQVARRTMAGSPWTSLVGPTD